MDATTATNDTALTFACANGHTDVTEILLNAGAELVGVCVSVSVSVSVCLTVSASRIDLQRLFACL